LTAVAGGSSSQTASTSFETGTTELGASSNAATTR
jgi:hypothetical protein